ncbi:hypothetical protein MKX01_013160 [Papaver californicum]|nr:hypothetical protein MKX01_013160 [Papaver californicum]
MASAITSCANQVSPSDEQPKTKTTSVSSLRRTFSAVDMSSPSGFSPSERIASSDELKIDQQQQQPGQLDIWCSIPIQKPSSLPPPYVHPLVRKSKSCLSLKSLEICTENLGSESGSNGYSPSNTSLSDTDEEHEDIHEEEEEEEAIQEVLVEETKRSEVVEFHVMDVVPMMNYNSKKPSSSVTRCFPPPLKSLSKPGGGGGIQMKTHRKDGRLVLEAVSVPTSQNCFNSQRQDGRLVLTFASPIPESKSGSFDNEKLDEEEEFECNPADSEIEELILEEENKGIVLKIITGTRVPKVLKQTGVMNVHRSAMNKSIGLTNSTAWSISPPPILAAGEAAPPPQQTVAAVCFNSYEYSWRKETSSMASLGGIYVSLNQQSVPSNTKIAYHNSNNLLTNSKNNYYTNNNNIGNSYSTTKGGKDYKEEKQNGVEHLVVPAYCKSEPKRSLVLWEPPHCIATS